MKIALLQTPTAPLNIDLHGGMERVELCELDTLLKKGHSAKLFSSKVIGKKRNVYQVVDLGWRSRVFKFFYYFNFGIRNRKCQIFHGHYTPILALLYPKKSVVHFHGLGVRELVLYRYFKERYHTAHYIFCARHVMDEFKKLYPEIPEIHLHDVYNGVDIETIKPPREKTISDSIKICFYAGWIPEKGVYEVLSAAEILEKKGRWDFKIHFGGSAYSHYKGKAGDADDIDRKVREWTSRLRSVELIGNIRYQDLPDFLAKMDLGLVPSTYPDPFPLVPLEMMSAGLPVIAYDVGGLKECVVDNETGFLVENKRPDKLAKKIEYFLDNRAEIERMGKAARSHVEQNFTWEKHVDQLVDIYEKILTSERKNSD